jgi:hypothetical protein
LKEVMPCGSKARDFRSCHGVGSDPTGLFLEEWGQGFFNGSFDAGDIGHESCGSKVGQDVLSERDKGGGWSGQDDEVGASDEGGFGPDLCFRQSGAKSGDGF